MNSYEDIEKFIFSQDSNLLNRPHSPRAFDQKIKWDVINIVAKCILKFLETKKNFSRKELQTAEYSNKLVTEIFKKPKTTDPMSANEYDKFFDQPLNYLSFFSILEIDSKKKPRKFSVKEKSILEYISSDYYNSINFIEITNNHIINCNNLTKYFDNFFEYQNAETYLELKDNWTHFIYSKTMVKKSNKDEPGRLFAPFLNIIAYQKNKKGTAKGRISKNIITFDELLYNRPNWYDSVTGKSKGITRKDWIDKYNSLASEHKTFDAAERIARRDVKIKHEEISEYSGNPGAIHLHHIFPRSHYPEFRHYKENLINLTPNEHMLKAHPDGKTQEVDKDFQKKLLIKKSEVIEESIKSNNGFYKLDNFIELLNKCYVDKEFIDSNFKDIRNKINL